MEFCCRSDICSKTRMIGQLCRRSPDIFQSFSMVDLIDAKKKNEWNGNTTYAGSAAGGRANRLHSNREAHHE
ncbi:hypothetical protein ASPFODRAFT_701395 [Aspergillus luchuensis CBS 106.47]|uniref:Uncharacterized protein n=1 Tax=Aspergillus luchuensis (strain CBS 106.47) TaxID=1137211 RepID=A0A1M3T6F0_ASPLC|nr:hypothetical protein ASPFODRAFT_701395 [Aspergillus luchuensis CBS 106.47]